jgi:hypothetical protein
MDVLRLVRLYSGGGKDCCQPFCASTAAIVMLSEGDVRYGAEVVYMSVSLEPGDDLYQPDYHMIDTE